MKATAKWIHKHKTARGGWTLAQVEAVGESWPPQHGWIGRAIGRELTDEQCAVFVNDSALAEAKRKAVPA